MKPEALKIGPWEKLSSERRGDYRVFAVREDQARSPNTGRSYSFYVIEADDWVNVIPVTPEGRIVFIRQWRHGTEEVTLEVPGGIIDPEDASPAAAARREMIEETGYGCERVLDIGVVAPNPAIQNNRCYTCLALGARPRQAQRLEGAEEIDVVEVAPADVRGLVIEGKITHALVVVAFYHLEQYLRDHPEVLEGAR